MEIRKAAVAGAGALGTMYGWQIGTALGWDALRIITDPVRAARYRAEGVLANGEACPFVYFDGTEPEEPADLVIFAVKFGGLEKVMEEAAPLIDGHTVLLSVMNGVTSEDLLAQRFGGDNVLLCTAQGMDATRRGNDTRFSHTGNLWFGPRQAGQEAIAAAEIVELTVDRTVRVDFPYVAMNAIMRVVKEQQPRIEEQTFDNLCTMRLAIRESRAAGLIEKLRKAGGSVRDEAE